MISNKFLGEGPYVFKDQIKSNKSNKFIGRGSERSSTNRYRLAWGDLANCGEYNDKDIVFVSAEGRRLGRIEPDFVEIFKACEAGVRFITDDKANRERAYNVGEREVSLFLNKKGYIETKPGQWEKGYL